MHLNETLEDMAVESCDDDDIASNSTLPSKIHIRSNNQYIYIRNTSVAPQEMNFPVTLERRTQLTLTQLADSITIIAIRYEADP